jgi:hypothetical protein
MDLLAVRPLAFERLIPVALAALLGCSDVLRPDADGAKPAGGGANATGPGGVGPNGNGTGGDGGANPPAFSACKGIDFEQDGVFDVDVKAIRVRGNVTIDGAAPSGAVGAITFTNTVSKASATAVIASDSHYSLALAPGSYDVAYAPDTEACGADPAGAWPCNGHVLQRGVALTASGVLDFDLATIVVDGAVTLQRQPWPSSIPASITFAEADASPATVPFAPGSYRVRLFKGTYVVGYDPGDAPCTTEAPCNAGTLRPNVDLGSSGALDVDVPMVVLRGAVSLDGTRMDATTSAGAITFSGAAKPISVPIAEGGSYALALLPATYAVGYSGVPSAPDGSPWPRGAGTLLASQAVQADGVLDLDVPTAIVSGRVTLDGASVSSEASGALSFGTATAEIRADGTYATVVLPGTYDVGYSPSPGCRAGDSFPCNGGKLSTVAVPAGGGAFDVDVRAVTVRGKMTLDGAALPPDSMATVAFTAPGAPAVQGESLTVDVGADGGYVVRLLAATYDVHYGGSPCAGGQPMPCNAGVLRPEVALESSGTFDLDVLSARIRGKVTLGGQPVPDDAADRGTLSFVGKSSGSASTDAFGPRGPIDYQTHLLRGKYVVTYTPTETSCDADSKSGLPCVGLVLAGCD